FFLYCRKNRATVCLEALARERIILIEKLAGVCGSKPNSLQANFVFAEGINETHFEEIFEAQGEVVSRVWLWFPQGRVGFLSDMVTKEPPTDVCRLDACV